ncbi:MAG: leucine-rich repeat domain-containing protein [Lachnospiraceae bacterium]|nr:leucine-rich repeat domain-containing protein [Lachnospiraceae bacterium]
MKKYLGFIITGFFLVITIALLQVPAISSSAKGELAFQLDGDKLVKYIGTATSVSIPSTVKEIGEGAFAGNSTIKSVKIPSSVERIDYGAFYGCTSLKGVTIPNSVETVETGAFAECTKLKSVKIGSGLKDWGYGVFAGDTSISSFKISSSNPYYKVKSGVVYDKDEKVLISYSAGKSSKEYEIPYGVEEVYPYAFWGSNKLKSVSVTGKVEEIGAYAFSNCNGLTNVYFSPSVKNIDRKAFENCTSLDEVKLPMYVQTIHETAFDGCENLHLNGGTSTVAMAYAEDFNSKIKEEKPSLEEIERKYAALEWGSNTEGERAPKSVVVEGHGPTKDMNQPSNTVSGNDALITNPDEQSGDVNNYDDFGRLLGSTRVVNNKAVVLIKP